MRPKRHLSVDDKHRKRLCIIPEFMRPESEHKRWNEHLPGYYRTLVAQVAPLNPGILLFLGIKAMSLSGDEKNGEKTKNPAEAGFKIGRRERIRTSDPLVPNQLRYQAALLADVLLF